jgi:hypothetical protein
MNVDLPATVSLIATVTDLGPVAAADLAAEVQERAIVLLVDAGYDAGDKDALGAPISEEVQAALEFALLRAPLLRDLLDVLVVPEPDLRGGA